MTARSRATWIAGAALALGLAAAGATVAWQARVNRAEAADRFASLARRVASLVVARMATYEYGLRGARGAVVAAGVSQGALQIDRQRFRDYCATRDLAREFPGVLGFGVIQRIAADDEASLVAAARRDGWPDFAIRQLEPHDGERYVIRYIEPAARNRAAIGLDVASDATRRIAAEAAMHSGAATLTAPITLVQAAGRSAQSFLLILPIYRPGAELATRGERDAATIGWTFAPLIIDDVLHGLDGADEQYTLALQDADGVDPARFYGSAAPDRITGPRAELAIPIFGRTWRAELRATPRFLRQLEQRPPLVVAGAGAGLAALLAVLVYLLAQRAVRSRQQRVEQVRRAAIVEGSTDAIIGESLDGTVTDWNAGAERLFGYPAALAVGRAAAGLVLPEGRASEDAEIRAAIARGDWVPPFDTTRQLGDGSLADVSVTASPIYGPDGQCVGLSKTVREISEARRAQRALAQLNATLEQQVADRTARLDAALHDLRTILDALPSLIGYWDRDLHNRVANRAYCEWFGVAPDRLHGHHMRDVVGDEMFERNLPLVEAVLRGEPQRFERTMPRRDGAGPRHALGHYFPDIVDGEVRGFYVLVHDITELTESRLRLAAAQRDNQALLETIQDRAIVSVTDRAGRITEISDSFCRISGYSRAELLGRNHRVINSGTHGGAFWTEMWRTISSGRAWRGEVCNRAKDGSLYWVDSIISPFLGADGKIDKYVSIRTDVTARKRAETELLETSSLLKAVLSAASEVSIIATNVDGEITLFNRGAERLLGHDHAEVVGRCTPAVFHVSEEIAARGAELSAEYGEPIAGFRVFAHEPEHHGPETREWTYVRKDGRHVPVSLTATAMRDDRGQLFGYLGVAHDVSRQKDHERSLREAVHEAKHASQAKSQFLANMSHEIRTPLNAVIGLSYLLERTPLDAEQAGYLSKITLASKSLLSIVNDVLDLSKIEAAELTIEDAPFHLGTLLHELSALMMVAAEAKAIDFAIDAPGDLPVALEGDAIRLRQVLTNLLSNAIKFTERGWVRLRVRELPGAAAGAVRLRFVVADSGIGIAREAMDRLFAPFAQADASTTRRFGGTGLGLSIVKQLVGLMGGTLGVDSTPDVGSEFWVELPLTRAVHAIALPDAVTALPARRGLAGVRVLVADDSAINLEVARRILELEGAVIRLAGNGQEAVDELVAHPDACDVVLMDIHMPVLDGYDATRRIRGLGLGVPIIALTAGALTTEQRDAESAGMTDFVSKPFDPQLLVSCIRRHLAIADRGGPIAPLEARPGIVDGWPAIDGIDAVDAHRRLAGDGVLFTALLKRLLNEFADLSQASRVDDAGLDGLAARMHSLKGSAGTLGARSLHQLAAETEQACRAHQVEQAAALLLAVAHQLRGLQRSAGAALEPAAPAVTLDDGQEPMLDRAGLVTLLQSLRQLDLAALDRFAALSPQLRRLLGDAPYAKLHEQIANLQFGDAATTLESLRRAQPDVPMDRSSGAAR